MNRLFILSLYLIFTTALNISCSGDSTTASELTEGTDSCKNRFCIEVPSPFDVPLFDPETDSIDLYVIKVNDQYGYMNRTGEIVLQPQWQKAYPFQNGVAAVWMPAGGVDQAYINEEGAYIWKEEDLGAYTSTGFYEGLCSFGIHENDKFRHGFMNLDGKAVIPPIFNRTGDFHEGMAWVMIMDPPTDGEISYRLSDDEKNKREYYGFINKKGEIVADLEYHSVYDFQEGFAVVGMGRDHWGRTYGLINTKGEVVLPIEYDQLGFFGEDGLCPVKKDDLFGFIDTNMNVAIDFQFDFVEEFHEGFAPFAIPNPEKDFRQLYGLINRQGEIVVEAIHEDMYYVGEGFWQVGDYEAHGLIDTTGKEIYPKTSTEMIVFNEGLAPVGIDGKIGFINTSGTVVIEPQWDNVMGFENGLCMVINNGMFWHAKPETEFGYINKKGEYVWPMTK